MSREWRNASADGARAPVRISRDLDFPRAAVFEMFTDPKKAATWFGSPEGAVKLVFEWDPRPGGALRIHDEFEGRVGRTTGTILELVAPERLVFRSVTTIGDGTVPFEALQTVTLEELGPRRTRLTVLVQVLALGSFPGGVGSLEEGYQGGWAQTLDMLQRELTSAGPERPAPTERAPARQPR